MNTCIKQLEYDKSSRGLVCMPNRTNALKKHTSVMHGMMVIGLEWHMHGIMYKSGIMHAKLQPWLI